MDGGRSRGFTLLQLLVCLAILAIMTTLSWPGYRTLIGREQARQAITHFHHLFQFARNTAINAQKPVTVCALTPDNRCTHAWNKHHAVAVFFDTDNNRKLDDKDQVLRQTNWASFTGKVRWGASLGRQFIRFEKWGNTWQNGTLYYCPKDNNHRFANALVISHSGRSYIPGDNNKNGIAENREGKDLICNW